jgi:hypothetical protein
VVRGEVLALDEIGVDNLVFVVGDVHRGGPAICG